MILQYIIKGIIIGLAVSIPLGPIGVLIIQKTIQKGRLAGFVSGMGAAVADTLYATVAALGLSVVINFIKAQEFYLQIIGSIFLIFLGARIYFSNPIKQLRAQYRGGKRGMLGDFLSTFFLTASNPITVFVFIGIFAGASVFKREPNLQDHLILISSVTLGCVLWWFSLSTIINVFRKKFRLKQLFWINRTAGIIVAILGALALLASFEPFKSLIH